MSQVGPLLIFDFDHTITDQNTDVEVQKLAPGGEIPQSSELRGLYTTEGWTQFMAAVFELLHQNNVTRAEILSLMSSLNFISGMETLLRAAVSELAATIIIVSDSNSVFIDHILQERSLSHVVEKVFTNPAWWEGDKLCIRPFHHQETCKLSTKNLCKGQILEEYLKECKDNQRFFSFLAYVGDGKNDYCPSLRLSESDIVFPRHGYTLQKVIEKTAEDEEQKIKAEICYWTDGEEILEKLKQKIGLLS